MNRLRRKETPSGDSRTADWSSNDGGPNCWPLASDGRHETRHEGTHHAAWAALPGQHPAAEERLSRLVQAIEHDIIPRLVRAHAHPGGAAPTPGTLPASEVQAFTQLVMARDDGAIERQLVLLRERGVSVETLFVDLLAPAARHLGALWEDDRCHFGDVTVGLGRLQQIMRSLSSAFGTAVHAPVGGRRALLMPAPGEQHTFGLSMVAEFFGRAGWEVVGLMDPAAGHYRDRVKDEWFDLVGLSAGSTTRLEAMAECIATVRQQSHNRAVALLVGGPLFLVHPELVERLGADGVVTDGRQAPMLAERLMGRRVMG